MKRGKYLMEGGYNQKINIIGENMSSKTPAIISSILTIVLLIIFAVLSVFMQMLVLNGASERQGFTAMGISLACQGITALLVGLLAGRVTNLLISKFNWNNILAVAAAVIPRTALGGLVSFLSVIIAIPLAGIR